MSQIRVWVRLNPDTQQKKPRSGSAHNKEKVTVPVPVPAPYLEHKKQIKKKNLEIIFTFYLVSYFTRKKLINFNKFMVKCEWKKCLLKEIKYIILCLVPVPTFWQVTVPVPVPLVKKLRFLRFRFRFWFHNTGLAKPFKFCKETQKCWIGFRSETQCTICIHDFPWQYTALQFTTII